MSQMVVLFLACLSGGDGRCEFQEPPFDGGPIECASRSELVVARWLQEHPGWELHGPWRCVVGQRA